MVSLPRTAILVALLLVPIPALADLTAALTAIERRDFGTAARELGPLAKAGDAEAQYQLGTLYANGDGVPQDYDAAKALFSAAASQGNGRARRALEFLADIGAISWGAPPQRSVPTVVGAAATGGAAVVPTTTGDAAAPGGASFRLQLGTVLTEGGGTAEARRVARRFQAALAGTTVAAEPYQMASGDTVYRVVTPALPEPRARELCEQIRGENGHCLLINP